jgi:hypothetical protein
MKFSMWRQRFSYHWKRYLAVFFASVGTAFLLAEGILDIAALAAGSGKVTLGVFSIWNFVIYAITYLFILIGNVKGTMLAFNGVLMFVFMGIWDAGELFFLDGAVTLSAFFSYSWQGKLFLSLVMFFIISGIVSGIMTYLRLRQYLSGRYAKYGGVLAWAAVFCVSMVLFYGFEPALLITQDPSLDILYLILQPLSEVAIAVAVFFTVTRLKAEY